ncbi:DNA excision repair protein ERCC-1 isoform X2 [Nelusetta ayraudi]|uniref:DNA excision repair protein ERCC-1 isoform X2 n=1 Tax=Nelusetta ayraudi TaxID=303726 RepID=UPI003F71E172
MRSRQKSVPKPHFQPSSKRGATPTTSSVAAGSGDQPLSYADFIVQSKRNPPAAPLRESSSKQARTVDDVTTQEHGKSSSVSTVTGGLEAAEKCAQGTEGESEVIQKSDTPPEARTDPKEGSCAKSDTGVSLGPRSVGSGSSIIVSPRQRGNPILKFVRSVPWEFADVVPDYVLGQTTCALFLSLRYHNLNPNYIHDRLKLLGQSFTLRVLLVQVDVKDPHHALRELARICIMADCTLILAWSPEEAGRYLETYKSYEKKPADLLKEQVEKNYLSKVTDCLTTVKSINKTDAITLLSTFSSVEKIISASKEDLVLCPGLGPQKARRLYDVLHKPFLKSKTNNN